MISSVLLFAQISSVQFAASVTPNTVYIGQQVSFDAYMRANVYAQTNFQTNPEYTPPDIKGVTIYDFPFDTLKSIHDVSVDGLTFKQYTYHRAVFPITPGSYTIPQAILVYSLPNEQDAFVPKVDTVRSKPQTFTAIALPTEGRPANFTGAVGDFTVAARTDSGQKFHSGMPFVLTVTVTGTGDIDLLPAPAVQIPWAVVVKNSQENVTWDSTSALVHGSKQFQWLVNPQDGGQLVIPAIQYSYFDPHKKQYVTAATTPLTLTVAGGKIAGGLSKGVMAHDSVNNSPFPTMMRAIRAHMVLTIVIAIVILIIILGIIFLALGQEPVD